jgi:catechol 2,3-dioxygenase-like lactoylglutathione lyase family enzyme
VDINPIKVDRLSTVNIDYVGHIGLTVSDLDNAIAFYRDILGFPVSEKVKASGELLEDLSGVPGGQHEVCFVRAPGLIIELLCYSKPEGRLRSKLRACDAGAVHIALKVRNIAQVIQAIRCAGFEAFSSVKTLPDGPLKGMRVVKARDPDGVVLELVEEPPGVVLEEVFF